MDAFGLEFSHGLGLGMHERPIISRLNSLEEPVEIKPGMVFALGDLLPGKRRLLGGAHRGGDGRHRQGLQGDHAIPGAGIADRQHILSAPGELDAARPMK